MRKLTRPEVIHEMWVVHNGEYLYDEFEYTNNMTKAIITCRQHGNFMMTPNKHKAGQQCPKCAGKGLSHEDIIDQFTATHGETYDYSNTATSGKCIEHTTVTCRVHGAFRISPNNHKRGKGCPKCGDIRSRATCLNEPTILYYIRFDLPTPLYKIGITLERIGVAKRYRADSLPYTVLSTELYATGEEAYNHEQHILQEYSEYKYSGPDVLKGGNSELFTTDILKGFNE